jgi:hypothetical protein
MLWIFIILKNTSPQPGLNPWTLGQMASTLTDTPLRWMKLMEINNLIL